MPWKDETIMSTKEDFVRRALNKEMSFTDLCDEYQISRKTGYIVLNKYKEKGLSGLEPQSRRPSNSPSKTEEKIEDAIITTRLKFCTWGPRKIIKYLKNSGLKNLPGVSTVSDILKRNNLITIEESQKRKKLIRFEREAPNDLWQMDFKGKFQLLTKQSCYPLTIIDDHSRFSITIKACANEKCFTVKKQLIQVFQKYGLPKQINVDNGNPWGNSKLLPYTELTVWLMQLGIRITHSRPHHPQTNGKCERFHRTLKNDLILKSPMRNYSHAQILFNRWRKIYNHERPHEALNMEVPASRYQTSQREMSSKMPVIEYNDDAIVRKVRGNGYICYKNKEYLVGEAFKGQSIEVKMNERNREVELYFGMHKIYTYDY